MQQLEKRCRSLCAELERRIHGGETVRAEDYLRDAPEIAADMDMAVELIYSEFLARHERGEAVAVADYLARFPERRERLERLFKVHELLSERDPESKANGEPGSPRPGDRLGRYELLQEIGRGGMGVVFKARDVELDRTVAIKFLREQLGALPEEQFRFRQEALMVASLKHPNIIPVHEVGTADGRTFLVFDWADGGSLADRIGRDVLEATGAEQRLIRSYVELVRTIARAVDYMHQHRLVHRDLKPKNILLSQDGAPMIVDFGLALRLQPQDRVGQEAEIAGTLVYMAPEQVRGASSEVGPPADIYALGAMLYELLTGRTPFAAEPASRLLQRIAHERPIEAAVFNPCISADLSAVCMKCLEKAPHLRYASAGRLADDLDRVLAGEPVEARPIGASERALKWIRRRPLAAGLIGTSALSLVVLLGGSIWYNARLTTAARSLQRQLDVSRRDVYGLQLAQVESVWRHDPLRALELLEDSQCCPPDLRDFTWRFFHQHCDRKHSVLESAGQPVHQLALLAAGRTIVAGCGSPMLRSPTADSALRIWDRVSGRVLATYSIPRATITSICKAPDDKRIAVACIRFASPDDPTQVSSVVELWNLESGKAERILDESKRRISDIAFTPDGSAIVSGGADRWVRTRSIADGASFGEFLTPEPVDCLAVSPDGSTVATGGSRIVRLWDSKTGKSVANLTGHTGNIVDIAFAPDAKMLATASSDRTVILWNRNSLTESAVLRGHTNVIRSVTFSDDGSLIATASDDHSVRLWDAVSGDELLSFKKHDGETYAVEFLPSGSELVSGGADQAVRIWDVASPRQPYPLPGSAGKLISAAFSPDHRLLASYSRVNANSAIQLWNASDWKPIGNLRPATRVRTLAFAPDGSLLAAAGDIDFGIELFDVNSREPIGKLTGHEQSVTAIIASPCGRMLASASNDNTVRVWDVVDRKVIAVLRGHEDRVKCIAATADWSVLATGGLDATVRLWDGRNWRERAVLRGHKTRVAAVAISPDGKTLASGGDDQIVKLWDLATLAERAALRGHTHHLFAIAFAPDGNTLVTASGDMYPNISSEVKFWDPVTGQIRATFPGFAAPLAFSPDGETLLTGSNLSETLLWQTTPTASRSPLQSAD